MLLVGVAMAIYLGGSFADPASSGYSFFENCLSAQGMTVTPSGHANGPAPSCFCWR